MILFAAFIALGTWFTLQDDIRVRQHHALDSANVRIQVYAPVEQNRRCQRIVERPVFRDLKPPTST